MTLACRLIPAIFRRLWATACICLVALVPNLAFAASPPPTQVVEVTGVGDTRAAARQEAYRAAVEKVVGSYVTADLITENEEIIKDEVLGFSAGFIDSAEVLSEGKREDGLYAIHLKATVVVQKVVRQLERLNISVSKVNSESLFAEASTKINQRESAQTIWSKFWDSGNWWTRAFDLKVLGKPGIVPFNQGDEVYAMFQVSAQLNEDFANELESTIRGASEEVKEGFMRSIGEDWQGAKGQGRHVVCVARLSNSDKINASSANWSPSSKPETLPEVADLFVNQSGELNSRSAAWDIPIGFYIKTYDGGYTGLGKGVCGLIGFPYSGWFGNNSNDVAFEATLKDAAGNVVATQNGVLISRLAFGRFPIISGSVFYRGDSNIRWIGVRMNKADLDRVVDIELSVSPNAIRQ